MEKRQRLFRVPVYYVVSGSTKLWQHQMVTLDSAQERQNQCSYGRKMIAAGESQFAKAS
jgi:hypothetical protein